MPGVVITTAVRTGPTTANVAPASTYFVCGTAERGFIGYNAGTDTIGDAKLVTSLADFETYYGEYNSSYTLHQHVQTFFEEGGARAYVSRVVGASATAGILDLDDSAPTASLRLTAANTGAWSANMAASVTNTGSEFTVKIYLNDLLVYSTGSVATVSAAVDKINSSSVAAIYVTASVLASQGSAVLATAAAASFSAGDDGTAPSTANLVDGLEAFDASYGAGAVAIPEQTNTTAYDGIIAHAVANNRIALLAIARTDSVNDAITTSADYSTETGAEYAGFYYPFVKIVGTGGVVLPISPESYVAAKRSVAHSEVGPWQAAAGLMSQAVFVTGLDVPVSKSDADALDEGRVNALRVIQNAVRIYGARCASNDETNYRYITYRDMLNYVTVEAARRLEDLVFSPIDGRKSVFGHVESRLIGLLDPLRTAGGLYEAYDANGKLLDPGYSVVVNDSINPVSQLATGLVKARVGVRVSSVGDQIQVEILKSNLTNSVV